MAGVFTTSNLITLMAPGSVLARQGNVSVRRSRLVSHAEGRAIEILGHAIEYLADEFAADCVDRSVAVEGQMHPRLQAIEILMALNREIYLNCPELPGFGERVKRRLWRGLRRQEA